MNAFLALVRKDLLLYVQNRRALIIGIVAPILIAAFFGSLFGGPGNNKPANIPIAITDFDHSETSARLVVGLRGDPSFTLSELGADEALAQVKAGKLRAAITLPAGFGAQAAAALLGGGAKPEIALHHDPSQNMVLPMVRGLLTQHVLQAVSRSMFGGAGASASGPSFSAPFTTREIEAVKTTENSKYNGYAHSFAGMGVQFILLMGVEAGVGLLLMRRLGLWKRLRAAPLSRARLLGSRIASGALIALVQFAVIYGVAMTVFKVRIDGSVLGFIALLIVFALLTASFGLLIAALGRTPESTCGLATLATLLLVMLGGAWVPSFVFPPWLQTASLFVPTRWAIDGLDAMTWRGQGFDAALLPLGVMALFAVAFAAIAIVRFDWEE
ncbi:MAG: ABC transporter permease [Burkholderiales bacterium]|nr:ABC transporter permease [Burkholderiales bacterium]